MNINDPIERLALVGPQYAKRLKKLGIETIWDLIFHFPFRYDDFSLISPIGQIQVGEIVTIKGKIIEIKNEYTRRGRQIQKATVADETGQITITWFNQPYLARSLKKGIDYFFSGKVDRFGSRKTLTSPEHEPVKAGFSARGLPLNIHTGRLVPVYPETAGVSSKWLRSRLRAALERFGDEIEEFLPRQIISAQKLIDETNAIIQIHFPDHKETEAQARYRLAFDELFLIQLAAFLRKKAWRAKNQGQAMSIDREKIKTFLASLPFKLTGAQEKAIEEVLADIGQTTPMNRLLEGDVGSGKTIVAAAAAYATCLNGYQTLLMAPTEILAQQHDKTFRDLFEPLGIKIELVTGGRRSRALLKGEKDNKPGITIGTHSLLYRDFGPQVGLVIADEQHRFGVEQRALLAQKGRFPHFLTMTATPIPRTVALTLYGDLDLSVLDELPFGRQTVKTWVVPQKKRADAYQWIRERIKNTTDQGFIICPLIEESENLTTVKAATKEFEELSSQVFPDLKLGLLHGRLKSKEKEQVLADFRAGQYDILVATPVVEVGIDIPMATIMVIEASERFGLAQLHQLRGRVGRSQTQSYCLLFTENETPPIITRLKSLEKTHLGMELAEIDLRLRGPGEIYGTKQHGFVDLKVASLGDLPLIQKTRQAALAILESKNLSPELQSRLKKYKIKAVGN